jgi:hypothetical protein
VRREISMTDLQLLNIDGSPFPHQGFPSPQRSPMVPQGMPPQVYQYQGTTKIIKFMQFFFFLLLT